MAYSILFIVSLLIPYPSVQHFIWPLHWCLLADICNHTYIPECGTQNFEDKYDRRLFIDECDLFEYNCDSETDFYPINYSSCFNLPPRPCPPVIPCPSIPPCPDHRLHNTSTTSTGFELVSKFKNFVSKFPVKKTTLGPSSPKKWNATEKEPDLGPSSPEKGNTTEKEPDLGPSSPEKWNTTEKEPDLGPSSPEKLNTTEKEPDLGPSSPERRYTKLKFPNRDVHGRPGENSRTFIKKKKKSQQMKKRFTVKKTITKKAPTSKKTKMGKKNGRKFNKAIKAIVKKKSPKKKSSKKKKDNS